MAPAHAQDAEDGGQRIATFYDQRGDNVLRSVGERYLTRYDDLIGRPIRAFIEESLPPPAQNAAFLDLCCGTGAFSIHPALKGYRVWGVDLSPTSILAAQHEAKITGTDSQSTFSVIDAVEFLSKTPDLFDVICICGSLYYLDRSHILPLIQARLKPGGMFLCLETNGSNMIMSIYRRFLNLFRKRRDPQTLHRLLRLREFTQIASQFDEGELRYFDFLTLLTPLFYRHQGVATRYHAAATRIDNFLLNRLALHCFAFKVALRARSESSLNY